MHLALHRVVLLMLALVCCGKLAQSCLLPIWCLPLQLHGAHLGCISQWAVCLQFGLQVSCAGAWNGFNCRALLGLICFHF